jgi:prephenate dehydrogenase
MKLGVYGLGRFGAFWGGELSKIVPVYGYSRNSKRDLPRSITQVSEEELCRCDVIVLCVAISAMQEVCRRIAPLIGPKSLVMDTCSVKVYPVAVMEQELGTEVEIVGTHPMFGPDSGRNGVEGLPIVYAPRRVSPARDRELRELFAGLKLKLVEMTPDEHDRDAAYTQGITHFLGRVLQDLNLQSSEIATLGYRKLLEIVEQTCNDPEQLFIDLQRFNPHTHEMRESLKSSLERFMALLKEAPDLPS